LARIPILVTGSWVKGGRDVSFTRDELSEAVDNFQKLANHDLNVDYDHASEDLERAAGEPTPSAGRILALDEPEEFRDPGPGTRDTGKHPAPNPQPPAPIGFCTAAMSPRRGRARLIKNREYRYVSAAFAKDYPDRKTGESQGLTLTSVALTNQPFLDELPEVWLSTLPNDDGCRLPIEKQRVNRQSAIENRQFSPRLSAEQGGEMPTLNMKCSAEGTHEAWDGDRKVGEIENDHLYDYASRHAGKDGPVRGRQAERAWRGHSIIE
jgi:hypothetical protein